VQRARHFLAASVGWLATVCSFSFPAWSPAACFGQHTVVQDAGGGRKMELVYNAAEQVVEMRTVDMAGKLQVRVEHEYRPGFLVPQETATSYWPDGKTQRSVTRVSYDENGNFTGEVIRLFGQTGARTGGSRLTHDPFTGIYRCARWKPEAQDYQPAECPSGEGSPAREEAKALTYDEAMKQLELAGKTRLEQQKAQRMERMSPIQPPLATVMKEVGVILPAQLHPGKRVSGSVVPDPQEFEGASGLRVIRMKLPLESQGEAAALRGWAVEAAGEGPQRCDGPIVFTVPRASEFSVTLRQAGNPSHAVSSPVGIAFPAASKDSHRKPPTSRAFEAAALCLKGDLCAVRGPFGGDSARTLIAFGSRPAPIVAETEDAVYIRIPEGVPRGPVNLLVADGARMAALPVTVAELNFSPNLQGLRQGQPALVQAMLSGPEELADEQWRLGALPALDVERARSLDPGFELPRDGKGVVLLALWNTTPEAGHLRGSRNDTFVFKLTADSFEQGEFKYQFVVEPAKSGGLALRATLFPFLASVRGRQFAIGPGTPTK